MVKCTFCANEFPKGTGKIFVKKDGKIFYFVQANAKKVS